MDFRTDMPEYGADATPGSNSEYLRALKRSNQARTPPGPASSPSTAPATILENQPSPAPAAERRRSPRYKCEGSAEFRTEGIEVRTWARITDISRGGCYVEMQATSPLNTAVNMVIEVNGIRFRVKGTVRTCYPLLGMGIEFTEIADDDRKQLEELLLRLGGGASPPSAGLKSAPAIRPAPDLLMIMDPGAALNALARFFETNRALSREEFTELIGKSQNRDRGGQR
jgi:hypothetical protein